MATLDNLRTRKLQLEQHLAQGLSEDQREHIEAELTKIEIALSFLDDAVGAGRPGQKAADEKGPPAGNNGAPLD
jgi:hypothetical protein